LAYADIYPLPRLKNYPISLGGQIVEMQFAQHQRKANARTPLYYKDRGCHKYPRCTDPCPYADDEDCPVRQMFNEVENTRLRKKNNISDNRTSML
jgi:hypothetical protein